MAKITALDSKSISMWIHSEAGIIHHEIHEPVHGEPFRKALDTGIGLMTLHQATKWLSDDRKNGPLDVADSDWARDDWFPRAVEAGWKYWAVVLPEAIIGQMNMKLFTGPYARAGVSVRVSSDPETALKWLRRPTAV